MGFFLPMMRTFVYLEGEERQRIEVLRQTVIDDVNVFRESRQEPARRIDPEKRHRQVKDVV